MILQTNYPPNIISIDEHVKYEIKEESNGDE